MSKYTYNGSPVQAYPITAYAAPAKPLPGLPEAMIVTYTDDKGKSQTQLLGKINIGLFSSINGSASFGPGDMFVMYAASRDRSHTRIDKSDPKKPVMVKVQLPPARYMAYGPVYKAAFDANFVAASKAAPMATPGTTAAANSAAV